MLLVVISLSSEFETWKKLGNILASGCAGKGLHKQPWSRCYRGHLNIRTTKSVSFLGSEQNIVAAGSDDGRMFLWDRETGTYPSIGALPLI